MTRKQRKPAPELQYSESLADGLRRARLSADIGFREAARHIGIESSNLWRIEKGQFTPSFETLGKMLRLYKANLNIGPDGVMLTWQKALDENGG